VKLELVAAKNTRDRGGCRKAQSPAEESDNGRSPTTLGVELAAGGEARLQHVYAGGPAERAGLAAGDVLVAIDGLKATLERIAALLASRGAGETVPVHAFRRDELLTVSLTLAESPRDTCWLALDPAATPEALARRAAWLGG
jgi:predicted metalloprotease with PDZ domain